MEKTITRIAEEIEAYCGISIKDSNTYNFSKVVKHVLTYHSHDRLITESLLQEIAEGLIIHETFFFRQPNFLKYIKEQINKASGPTSILSIGTSTGEEIYSVSLYLNKWKLAHQLRLHGIDLSHNAIEHARQGVYNQYKMRNTDTEYLEYFEKRKGLYHLKDEIKNMVTLTQLNLLRTEELRKMQNKQFDIVLARNIFIYFQKKLPNILSNINSLTKPGGVLITTPVEYEKVIKADLNNMKVVSI